MRKLKSFTNQQAQKNFSNIIKQVQQSHRPVLITGKQNNVILLSQEDWEALHAQAHPAHWHPLPLDDSNELPCTD